MSIIFSLCFEFHTQYALSTFMEVSEAMFLGPALKVANCTTIYRHACKICNCTKAIKFAPSSCNNYIMDPLWHDSYPKYESDLKHQHPHIGNSTYCLDSKLSRIFRGQCPKWFANIHTNKYEHGKDRNTSCVHTSLCWGCLTSKQILISHANKYEKGKGTNTNCAYFIMLRRNILQLSTTSPSSASRMHAMLAPSSSLWASLIYPHFVTNWLKKTKKRGA